MVCKNKTYGNGLLAVDDTNKESVKAYPLLKVTVIRSLQGRNYSCRTGYLTGRETDWSID